MKITNKERNKEKKKKMKKKRTHRSNEEGLEEHWKKMMMGVSLLWIPSP